MSLVFVLRLLALDCVQGLSIAVRQPIIQGLLCPLSTVLLYCRRPMPCGFVLTVCRGCPLLVRQLHVFLVCPGRLPCTHFCTAGVPMPCGFVMTVCRGCPLLMRQLQLF